MKHKRHALRKHASRKKLHCILLFNPKLGVDPNFFHLTGFDGYGCLVLLKDREILFVPKMEYERAKKTVKGVKVEIMERGLKDPLKKYAKGRVIGLDYGAVTLRMMKSLRKQLKRKRFADVSSVLLEVRKIKNDKEIAKLKKACGISDSILEKCFSGFRRFRTEKDVADFLEEEAIKRGCDLSFPPIVASGSNAAEPHHTPKSTRLKRGFCIIDFGVKCGGYCSDTTRTIYLGKPSREDIKVYDFMLKLQQGLIDDVKEGDRCSDIYAGCIKKMGKYAHCFNHGLGHGVGVEIHELPNLSAKSRDRINEGMVFTIEPGIYISGRFGIRIEDTILMAERPLMLTRVSKRLRVIKR